jgi:hypothetical protein
MNTLALCALLGVLSGGTKDPAVTEELKLKAFEYVHVNDGHEGFDPAHGDYVIADIYDIKWNYSGDGFHNSGFELSVGVGDDGVWSQWAMVDKGATHLFDPFSGFFRAVAKSPKNQTGS